MEGHPTREIVTLARDEVNAISAHYQIEFLYKKYSYRSDAILESVNNMDIGIKSVKDLLAQNEIQWGTVKSTHTETILQSSVDPFYKELYTRAVSVSNDSEGARKVRNEKYVFIFETPIIDYEFIADCDVIRIGGEFQTFEYALGFPKDSPYAELINSYILQYRETGVLDGFWSRWLGIHDTRTSCPGSVRGKGAGLTLGMSSMAGIFFALVFALVVSLVILTGEYIVVSVRDSRAEATTPWTCLVNRVRNLLRYTMSSRVERSQGEVTLEEARCSSRLVNHRKSDM